MRRPIWFLNTSKRFMPSAKASNGREYEGRHLGKLSLPSTLYGRAQPRSGNGGFIRLKSLTLLARQYDIGLQYRRRRRIVWRSHRSAGKTLRRTNWRRNRRHWLYVIGETQKRCPLVIDYLSIWPPAGSRRRLMIRLVKGACWDSGNQTRKWKGLEGLSGLYPQKGVCRYALITACAKNCFTRT